MRAVREGGVGGQSQIDGVVTLTWNGSGERFAIEYKTPGTPKQVETAIAQLRRYLGTSPDLRPLIVAPYLKPELLERLVEEGISAVDLSGNMAITIPDRWLVIRSGEPNRYPASATIKNVYRGRSSLVARALLSKGSFPSATSIVNELSGVDGVKLPTVSKVLASLEEALIVARNRDIRVIQPDRLLENLLANYQPPVASERLRGKIGRDASVMARLRANADAAGLKYAADRPERYTILPTSDPVVRIFTTSIRQLLGDVSIDTMSRFPDVEFVETDDPTIYYGRVAEGDTYCTSALVVYLELASGGKRERQAARPIMTDLLARFA